MASSTAAGDLMMDGELDGGRRSLDSQAVDDLMMDGELAGLPGFSARQGEQEVHSIGISDGDRLAAPRRWLLRPLLPIPNPGA